MKVKKIVLGILLLCVCFSVFSQNAFKTNMRVMLHKNRGTFRFMSVNSEGELSDLLDYFNEGASSFFAVKIGRPIYRMQRMDVDGEHIDSGGGELVYNLSRKVSIRIKFFPISSQGNDFLDAIKVEATVTNIGKKGDTFALRALFDTVLGESIGKHFSTAKLEHIDSEIQLTDMREHKFISSSNGVDTINFLLHGNGITDPDFVTMGSKDILSTNGIWIPSISYARSFNSIVSYNNSAICINWSEKYLNPDESTTETFYITIGTDGNKASTSIVDTSIFSAPAIVESVENMDMSLMVSHFDMEYINGLLKRIEELEMDGSNTNLDEIRQLNEELDKIFERLRR